MSLFVECDAAPMFGGNFYLRHDYIIIIIQTRVLSATLVHANRIHGVTSQKIVVRTSILPQ